MKFKIGVFGSNAEELSSNVISKAKQIGNELANYNIVIITGGSSGVPYLAAHEAAKGGIEVWGFSPVIDIESQRKFTPDDDISIYKRLIYIPRTFEFSSDYQVSKKYRNVISTANCDAGIIISGRWGTLNEFTNLFDMGKVIGVLTGTGGVADELPILTRKIKKKSKSKVIFNNDPKKLISDIINMLAPQRYV